MGATARVRSVEISAAMNAKINSKHGITADEVLEVCLGHARGSWHVDPVHGRRLLVKGHTAAGRGLKVILQPVDEAAGRYRLRTALVARKG